MMKPKVKAYRESTEKRQTIRSRIVDYLNVFGLGHIGLWRALFKVRHQSLTSTIDAMLNRGEIIPHRESGRWTEYRLPVSDAEKRLFSRMRAFEKVYRNLKRLQSSCAAVKIELPDNYYNYLAKIWNLYQTALVEWQKEKFRNAEKLKKLDLLKEKWNEKDSENISGAHIN